MSIPFTSIRLGFRQKAIASVVSYNETELPIAEKKLVKETVSRKWHPRGAPTND